MLFKNYLLISYFFFLLILPLLVLFLLLLQNDWTEVLKKATDPIAVSAYSLTVQMALCAALINTIFGFLITWILTRYSFRGRKLLDAAVDLPFALPTSVAGLTLATVYGDQGWIGSLFTPFGFHIVFTKIGVLLAMIFVSFPFPSSYNLVGFEHHTKILDTLQHTIFRYSYTFDCIRLDDIIAYR